MAERLGVSSPILAPPLYKSYDLWPDSEAETVKRHNSDSESETNSEFCVPLKINTESETILWDSLAERLDVSSLRQKLGKPWPPTNLTS